MIFKHISLKYLFFGLIIGIIFLFFSNQPTSSSIIVYPTPDNANKIEYKDKALNCFQFEPVKVKCPLNKSQIKTIPIQY